MRDRSLRPPLHAPAAALAAQGDGEGALEAIRAALEKAPQDFALLIDLSRLLYAEGAYGAAIETLSRAEKNDPFAAPFMRVQTALQRADMTTADELSRAVDEEFEGHPRAAFVRANIAMRRADFSAAADLLDAALAVTPANRPLLRLRVKALENDGAFAAALDEARAVARLDDDPKHRLDLATMLFRYGRNDEAQEIAREIPEMSADPALKAAALVVQGQIRATMGNPTSSIHAFRSAAIHQPASGAPWWGLADLKTYRFSAEDQATMRALFDGPATAPLDRCMVGLALGQAMEKEGKAPAAMGVYRAANESYPGRRFNPQAYGAGIDRMRAGWTGEGLDRRAGGNPKGPIPIFIVGMPRSGSTLVEQILASHSSVEGSIEHLTLPSICYHAHRLCREEWGEKDYLAGIGSLSVSALEALGERYERESRLFHSETARFVTDKLPQNFEHVGLIHKILPDARIIDVRRHPMDCGLSIYRQFFASGFDFSYDLAHIGAYYRGYLALMDHWDQLLPGRIFHLQYEDLVAAPERWIRSLLDFVGLPFEEACLTFHDTERQVRTASSQQVRQPLYSRSVGVWQQVEDHLAPLKAALGQDVMDRFTADGGA